MYDSWSLKDVDRRMNFKFFEPVDIELLRQHLIDDVNGSVFIDVGHSDIIDIINRRFGFDESVGSSKQDGVD